VGRSGGKSNLFKCVDFNGMFTWKFLLGHGLLRVSINYVTQFVMRRGVLRYAPVTSRKVGGSRPESTNLKNS